VVRVRKGSGVPIPLLTKRRVKTAKLSGEPWRSVIERFQISQTSLWSIMNDDAVMVIETVRRLGQLSASDRETISLAIQRGIGDAEIARTVRCHRSTIGREIRRNGGRGAYRAVAAEQATCRRASRPKATKLENHPVLASIVEDWLAQNWSPEQISARLRVEFPDDETMRVSAETIYLSIYVYGRGAIKTELAKHLRTRRHDRRPRRSTTLNSAGGSITDKVMIVDRPEEIEDRLVPGHWEGDLIIGANQASQIGTLVERSTGFALLIALPDNRHATTLAEALARQVATLPAQACTSITWDQGSEMAAHISFSVATDIAVYFCDPHAPWQRGTNENFNGLLRQYFPKGTDLSIYSQPALDAVAREINNRPRKRLGSPPG
jgi:IS30 family transposase